MSRSRGFQQFSQLGNELFFVVPVIVSLEPASGTFLEIVHFYIGDGERDLITIVIESVEQP
jgi:hypothetical protein